MLQVIDFIINGTLRDNSPIFGVLFSIVLIFLRRLRLLFGRKVPGSLPFLQ